MNYERETLIFNLWELNFAVLIAEGSGPHSTFGNSRKHTYLSYLFLSHSRCPIPDVFVFDWASDLSSQPSAGKPFLVLVRFKVSSCQNRAVLLHT